MVKWVFDLQRFSYYFGGNYIYNVDSDILLNGTDEDDYIKNGGKNEEDGADGEWDYGGSNVTITSGAGYDSIMMGGAAPP